MKNTATRSLLVIFIILALLGVGLWYFLFSSIHAHIDAASALQTETSGKLSKQSRDQALQSFLNDSTSTIATISSSIIDQDGTVGFIDSIESLGRGMGLGVMIDSVGTSDASTSTPDLENLNLTMTAQGSWSAVYQFLSAIETMPNDISISSVTLNQSTFSTVGTSTRSTWVEDISLSALKKK